MPALRSFIIIVLFLLTGACKQEPKKDLSDSPVTFTREATGAVYKGDSLLVGNLDIEIADTPYERQTGLMYRESMTDKQGMWFVFEDEAPRAFYMKNTLIGLDIIYADKNGKVVSMIKNARPLDEASLPSEKPAMFVLELTAGNADRLGIAVNDSIVVDKR